MKINIVRPNHVLVFAAEELKKYLCMMMPNSEDVEISFNSDEEDGFRLGLLEDFGLSCEAEDPVLDDVVHIDTTEKGGILAGSNPRSVLYAVYRFLRLNGCRFLYPGVDGEHVPVREIAPTRYHKMADHRFRGHCNEGAESQTCMLETIDFYAKQEINVYMIEFDIPFYYYKSKSSLFIVQPPEFMVMPTHVLKLILRFLEKSVSGFFKKRDGFSAKSEIRFSSETVTFSI